MGEVWFASDILQIVSINPGKDWATHIQNWLNSKLKSPRLLLTGRISRSFSTPFCSERPYELAWFLTITVGKWWVLSRANSSVCGRNAHKHVSRSSAALGQRRTVAGLLCLPQHSASDGKQPLILGLPWSCSPLGFWHNLEQFEATLIFYSRVPYKITPFSS